MGNGNSEADKDATGGLIISRLPGIGEGTRKHASARLPPNTTKTQPDDWPQIEVLISMGGSDRDQSPLIAQRTHVGIIGRRCVQACLGKLLLFDKLEPLVKRKTVVEMYERQVLAGEILIKEGDRGLAASELYVVKSGQFEVTSFTVLQ